MFILVLDVDFVLNSYDIYIINRTICMYDYQIYITNAKLLSELTHAQHTFVS